MANPQDDGDWIKHSQVTQLQADLTEVGKELDGEHIPDMEYRKGICLQTLIKMAELEKHFQHSCTDTDRKALATEDDIPNVAPSSTHDIRKLCASFQACKVTVRNQWTWLSDLSYCTQIHLNNATVYHQFFHDLRHSQQCLEMLLSWLNKQLRKKKEELTAAAIIQDIKNVLLTLLDQQDHVDELYNLMTSIVPLRWRQEAPETPVKVTALVDYNNDQVTIDEGNIFVLTNNLDPSYWTVCDESGKYFNAPAAIFLIPPPDRTAVDSLMRLRGLLLSVWRLAANVFRHIIVVCTTDVMDNTSVTKIESVDRDYRDVILNCLHDMVEKLSPERVSKHAYLEFTRVLQDLYRTLHEHRDKLTGNEQGSIVVKEEWTEVKDLIRMFQDFQIYVESYEELVDSRRDSVTEFIPDSDGKDKYVTKAYINKMKPVEIDYTIPVEIQHIPPPEETMYIHEKTAADQLQEEQMRSDTMETLEKICFTKLIDTEIEEDIFSSQTVKEVQKFSITGVIDPRDGTSLISIYSAVHQGIVDRKNGVYRNPNSGEEIPIPEAMSRGLIEVEMVDTDINVEKDEQGIIKREKTKEILETETVTTALELPVITEAYMIKSVTDPRTNLEISTEMAIKSGLLNKDNMTYIDLISGQSLSFKDAAEEGLINVQSLDAALTKNNLNDDIECLVQSSSDYTTTKYLTSGVIDPRTKYEISLKLAKELGIIDDQKGVYKNPYAGDSIKLPEALKKGAVKCKLVNSTTDSNADFILEVKAHQTKQQMYYVPSVSHAGSPSEAAYTELKDQLDGQMKGVHNVNTDEELTLDEADDRGVIRWDSLEYSDSNGETYTIHEAAALKYVDLPTTRNILQAYENKSLNKLINNGQIDPVRGLYFPSSGKPISIEEAIATGQLNPDSVFLFHPTTHKPVSLSWAIVNGLFNPKTGCFKHPVTGKEMSIEDAIEQHLIEPRVDVDKLCLQAAMLSTILPHVDKDLHSIKVPGTKEALSVENAILSGILDITTMNYVNSITGEVMSLSQAMGQDLVDSKTIKEIYNAIANSSLAKAIENGLIDPKTGKYKHPDTGEILTIQEAIDRGYLDPNGIYLVTDNGEIVTLAALIHQGVFNPVDGTFIDPETGKPLSIDQAMKSGFLIANVDPNDFVEEKGSLKKLMEDGLVSGDSTLVFPNGDEVTVKEALEKEYVTDYSNVKRDPKTGKIMLVDDTGVELALKKVISDIEWLSSLENQLVSQPSVEDDVQQLKQLITKNKVLQESLNDSNEVVSKHIVDAQLVIDANKEKQKDVGAEKQYQHLRFTTSDLALRHKAAQQTATAVEASLSKILNGVQSVHGDADQITAWIDNTRDKMSDMKKGPCDIDNISQHGAQFKTIAEEMSSQEVKLAQIIKFGDDLKNDVKVYEETRDRYNSSVSNPVRLQENGASTLNNVEDTVDNVQNDFKNLMAECGDLMTFLNDLATTNQEFNALKTNVDDAMHMTKKDLQKNIERLETAESEVIEKELGRLRGIKSDLADQAKQVDDLKELTDVFIDKLRQQGTDQQAIITEQIVKDLDSCLADLQADLNSKESDLTAVLLHSKDVSNNFDKINAWVTDAENRLDNMTLVSLDRDILNKQITDHRVLQSDLESEHNTLMVIAKQAHDVKGVDTKVEKLHGRFSNLESRLKSRGDDLEENVSKLSELQKTVQGVESWIVSAVKSLKSTAGPMGQAFLKDKILELHRKKVEKQPEMEKAKQLARALIDSPKTGEKNHLREQLADIQGKWQDLTDMFVQIISSESARDIDDLLKFLDMAEGTLQQEDPISIDPETLALQLRDHQAFDENVQRKKKHIKSVIDDCSTLLRETSSDDADNLKNRLEYIRAQTDHVCKLSSDRLQLLEEAMPLASNFCETQNDLSTWLKEIEAEIQAQDSPGHAADQIRKQVDTIKQSLRFVDDHKPLVDDLNNTGNELITLCSDEGLSSVKDALYDINSQYEDVKAAIRDKINELEDDYRAATTEVVDTADGLLDELHLLNDQLQNNDPIPANIDKIHDQISENQNMIEDLSRRQEAIAQVKDSAEKLKETLKDDDKFDVEELSSKITELEGLNSDIVKATKIRGDALTETLKAAEKFWITHSDVVARLQDISDNLVSQDPPHIETPHIRAQQEELKEIKQELMQAHPKLQECQQAGNILSSLCGESGQVEIHKHVDDVQITWEQLEDGVRDREDELDEAMARAHRFEEMLKTIESWLPKSEEKLSHMGSTATETRALRIQIEELKVFKLQVHPCCVQIESLNIQANELRTLLPMAAEQGLTDHVALINDRWNNLISGISSRENKLQNNLVRLGELDHALDDTIGFLQQMEQTLTEMDAIYGDPRFIETHIKKLKLMQSDLQNYDPVITSLNNRVTDLVGAEGDQNAKVSPLIEKQEEINVLRKSVEVLARDRQNCLRDILREAKAFMGEVEDMLYWLGNFRGKMRSTQPFGALPETANRQFEIFMDGFNDLLSKEDCVKALLLNGEDMLARCRPVDTIHLRESLGKLKTKWHDAVKRADQKKKKIEVHMENVNAFHDTMTIFTEWLANAESLLGTFKYPSKLVETCEHQINEHKHFREDIERHRRTMETLDKTGTYLKYFGRKQDTVFIKSQLVSIKLRWKKLVRKTDERGRLLQQAYKEDKRFYSSWKELMDWLNMADKKLTAVSQSQASPAKVKQSMDELKLSSKHPKYYSTTRLGRNLKDRCTNVDPERDVLQTMLDDLKHKWCVVRSLVSQRQNKLEESLLMSGRFSDALQSFLDWLSKTEEILSEDQPVLGDLDTVLMLIEQNKQYKQELENREGIVQTMRTSADMSDPKVKDQVDTLNSRWDQVKRLCDVRDKKLNGSHKLAERFQEVVNRMRDWLPQAEAELKFRPLPEDELAIAQLIERHEQFEEQMNALRPCIDSIKELGEEILENCHPNALRFVKYYLTITQTRWDQAQTRSRNRSKRLQEALRNIRGNAALLEELLAWLSEAHALLAQKDRDNVPEDLPVVEALVKEHTEFHDELSEKNRDLDRITKIPSAQEQQRRRYGGRRSTGHMPEGQENPRVNTLHNKWRTVWRMSVERKKRLQDLLDHLLELESFKNFDFDLWRQRYMNWIKVKKLRITDFFRRQDKEGRGILSREQFVDGMLSSGFPSNRTELNAVFDIFDRDDSGEIDYREFVEALRPRTKKAKRPQTDAEMVHDEIEQQVSHCSCKSQFQVSKVGEGKYRFGENQKLVLVRFLNSTVMVRVGGGWVTLQEFLGSHDPCQAKGRTNTELREKFILPKGAAQSRAAFTSRKASTPRSRASDAGYSSMATGSTPSSRRPTRIPRSVKLGLGLSGSYDCLPGRSLTPHRHVIMARSMLNLTGSDIAGTANGHGYNNNSRRGSSSSSTVSLSSAGSLGKKQSTPSKTPSKK